MPSGVPKVQVTVRAAQSSELDAIIDLAGTALGWEPGTPNAELFCWKHLENPFGASPMWVAEVDGRLAGFRTFLRWELVGPDGRRWRTARAVDTATHPDFQRMGIFSSLTRAGLEALQADQVDMVFNTPNDQSRPGYLKLGWVEIGRLPVAVRVAGPAALVRTVRARVPAAKWSEPVAGGDAALDVVEDPAMGSLLDDLPRPAGLATPRTVAFLRWRYRFAPLHYRAVVAERGLAGGAALFRVRRRGSAREATVTDLLVPGADPGVTRRLLAAVRRASGADYVLRLGAAHPTSGEVPLANLGPRLTARAVSSEPPSTLDGWSFSMGDIELF